MSRYLLAIDQGTSSSRAVVYGHDASVLASAQREFPQIFPQPGWVEHDPEAIWASVQSVMRQAMTDVGASAADITAIGITNQRETTLIWDRDSGRCVHNAIVWQDRRTAGTCDVLKRKGAEDLVIGKTGLRLDPYFSATKIAWILDNVPGVRDAARRGRARLRHDRQLPAVAPHRRARTRDRRDQCIAHDAVQYSQPAVGR